MNLQQVSRPAPSVERGEPDIGALIHRINDDLQGIARDEVGLARIELTKAVKLAAAEAGAVLFGGLVALFGLAMLFAAAVPALEPVIEPLWLRLLLVAIAYIGAGGAVAAIFVKRLKRDAKPDLREVARQATTTIQAVREGLNHG